MSIKGGHCLFVCDVMSFFVEGILESRGSGLKKGVGKSRRANRNAKELGTRSNFGLWAMKSSKSFL
jgi:hypothetical protein